MVSRIHSGIVYHDCHDCGLEIEEGDVSWATEDGNLTMIKGNPYCDACLPEKEDKPNRPPCDCDQSGGGYSLCSHCFAEQVGGE